MKSKPLTNRSFSAALITLLLLVSIPVASVFALTTSEIVPTGNGNYTSWTGDFSDVDEGTGSPDCGSSDSLISSTTNARESVVISLTSIPNGATITDVNVLGRDRGDSSAGGTYSTFVRFNGADSANSAVHTVTGNSGSCTGSYTDTFDVTDTVKAAGTTLEIGVVKTSGNTNSVRVGVLSATVTYTSTGATNAGTGADVSGVGTVTWSTPGNVVANDTSYATAAVSGTTTHYLQATNYGFAIPSGSTIVGIEATIGRFQSATGGGNDVRDVTVSLIKGGTVSGNNKAVTGTEWPTTETATTYGSSSDLWGLTWTATDINASNFGLALSVNSTNSRTASVDYMQLNVTYALPTTTTSVNCVANPIAFGGGTTCTATVTRSAGTNTPAGSVSWVTDGSGSFATSPCTLSGAGASATCSVTYTPSSVGDGTHLITATYAGNTNFLGSNGSQTVTVNKGTPTVSVTNSPVTYNGTPRTATVTGSVAGVVSDIKYNGSSTAPTNAGTYAVTADFVPTDTANYNSLADASAGNFVINKVTPTVSVTNSPVTYNGTPRTATVTGSVAGVVSDVKYNGSSTVPTNAGTYAITADFVPTDTTNYNSLADASVGNFTISQASSTTVVTCPTSEVYTGSAIEPCTVSVTGAGSLNLTPNAVYADNINVGTATASYTYAGDTNHTGSNGSDTFNITQASSTTVVSCSTGEVYTGSAIEPCTASYSTEDGLSGSLTVTYANNTDVGTATASATYTGDANHSSSSDSETFEITPASSTTVVSCSASEVYTGSPIEPCTASYSTEDGLSGLLTVTYANNTDVGTATASATYAGDANHSSSSDSETFEITPASSTTVVTCTASEVYTGSAIEPCTVSVTGANLSLTPAAVYADNINVGTATASYTYAGDANHSSSSDSETFEITPASSTTVVSCSVSEVYTGSAIEPCTASYSTEDGLSGSLTVTYANNTDVGTATASATYAGDANHSSSSDSETFEITPASSTTVVSCSVSEVYTGSAIEPCTASYSTEDGLSGSLTVTYANNTDVGTATASATYTGDANHSSSSDSETFEITPASSTTVVSCSVSEVYTGSAIEPCTASYSTEDGLSGSLTVTYADNVDVGTATASATYAGDANHSSSSDSETFEITPASSTTVVTCTTSEVYTGSAIEPCTASYSTEDGLSGSLTVTYADNVDVGTATASATYAGDANHSSSSDSETFEITPASSTTVVSCSASEVYTGSAIEPCTASYSTEDGLSGSLTVTYANNTDVGTATASATYSGDANHSSSSDSETFEITGASATVIVTCPVSEVYTGAAIEPCTASYSTEDGLSGSLTVTYANNTDVGTATASATYAGDANHSSSSDSETFEITPASATVIVTCPLSEVYTGAAIEPCTASYSTEDGLSGSLTVTYANNTDVGTATASATYAGDANHSSSSDSETFEITPASSTTVVSCSVSEAYTGSAMEPCTASYSTEDGLSGSLTVTYANNTDVGTATASATYAGDANHSSSSDSETFEITPASSTTVVSCSVSEAYTGSAIEPCTVSVTGVGGLNLSPDAVYVDNVDIGTATASYTYAGDANHSSSSDSTTFEITSAASTVIVTCPLSEVYTGAAIEPCTASYSTEDGLSGSLTVTYANNTDAGTATASATYAGDANHSSSSDSQTFEITPASSTTVVSCSVSEVYTGSAIEPCTASYSTEDGLSGSLTVTYANNTNAGIATASATYAGDANHTGSSDSTTFEITPASSTTVVTCPLSEVYTGSAIETCTVSVTGAGGLNLTPDAVYADNVNVGTATASYTYAGDVNHTGSSDSETFEITPDSSTTVVSCSASEAYTGSAIEPCTVSVTGAGGLNLTPDAVYADNVNVGTATASYTYAGDVNHTGSGDSETFEITPASSTTIVSCSASEVYTGSAIEPCTASYSTEDGLSGSLTVTYTNNTNAGTATASATYAGDANHSISSDSTTFEITQVSSTTVVSCSASEVYTGSAIEPCTASYSTEDGLSGSLTVTYADNVNVGTATASATYAGDANHSSSSDSTTFEITQVSSTTVVTCPASAVYTGSAIEPCTVSVTGAGGLNLTPDAVYADNVDVGTATASYTYAGDVNHTGSSDSQTFAIEQADTTTSISADTPDPSVVGQAVTVNYNVIGLGSGTPTGNVTVSDGVDSCIGTVAAGTCDITLTTVGARTLTATYEGDSNFHGSTSADESHTVNVPDTIAPSVTINQASGQADPTNTSPIHFTAIFSEPVSGFGDSSSDVTLSGTAGATTAVVTEIAPNDGTTYNIAVSGMIGSGTVIANIPSSAATDAASNGNTTSTSTDNTVTFNPASAGPMCNGQTATIYVNAQGRIVGGPDNGKLYKGKLNGTSGADVIVGTNGKDEILAKGGNDVVCGGGGHDTLNAGGGNDRLFGQSGNDTMLGEGGNDRMTGGSGADKFNGGSGTDTATDFNPGQRDSKTGVENF